MIWKLLVAQLLCITNAGNDFDTIKKDERRNKIVEETIDAKIAKEYRSGLTDIASRYRSKPVEISKERQTRGYVPPPVDWPEDKKKKWNKIQAMLGRYPGKEDCLATRSSRSCSYYLWGTDQQAKKKIRCFSCVNARTNRECNEQGTVECQSGTSSCLNEVREYGPGICEKLITKKCKETYSCKIQEKQNDRPAWFGQQCMPDFWINSHCRCCCEGDLCNDGELPCLTNSEKEDCSWAGTIAPNNGTVKCSSGNKANSVCHYSCKEGFSLNGMSAVTCNPSGEWSTKSFPRCEIAQCDMPLPDPKNGIVTCSQAKEYESVCKFYCDQGYTLSMGGEADEDKLYEQVHCTILGKSLIWEYTSDDVPSDSKIISKGSTLPTCERSRCPKITLSQGEVSCDEGFMYKSECRFTCNVGFELKGSTSVTCRGVDKPNWDNKLPFCKPIIQKQRRLPSKPPVQKRSFPIITINETFINSTVQKTLNQNVECNLTVPNPPNGQAVCGNNSCTLYCNLGYILHRDEIGLENAIIYSKIAKSCGSPDTIAVFADTAVPEENRVISSLNQLPSCKRSSCPSLSLSNGDVSCSNGNYYASWCQFKCKSGYELIGSKTADCRGVPNFSSNQQPSWKFDLVKAPSCSLTRSP